MRFYKLQTSLFFTLHFTYPYVFGITQDGVKIYIIVNEVATEF